MHILIWGNTPLAGFLAARLHAHYTITWLTDSPPADVLTLNGEVVRGLKIVGAITQARKPDLIILATPAWYTGEAAHILRGFAVPPPVVALHLGVGGLDRIEGALGGVVTARVGFGADSSHVNADLAWGGVALEAGHAHTESAAAVLRAAGLTVALADGRAIQWSSVLWGIQGNAISTILDIPPEEIYPDPLLFAYEYQQVAECLRVMGALGVRPVALPGVNLPRLAALMRWVPRRFIAPFLARFPRPPSLRDALQAHSGRSDAAYLNGAVAVHAYDLKIRAPVNHALALTVTDIAEGRALWLAYREKPALLFATLRLATGAG